MKKKLLNIVRITAFLGMALTAVNCTSDNFDVTESAVADERWITLAGSLQGTSPGDGNGGMVIYSVNLADAKNPDKEFSIFNNGYVVPSNRTARLNASQDGNFVYNIPYTGDNGGIFSKFRVGGGNSFQQEGASVSIAQYATASPRWGKLYDGDNTGVAANIAGFTNGTNASGSFAYTRGDATLVSFDLKNPSIKATTTQKIPLTADEEQLGYHIWRMDAPVLNRAGNKLLVGTWMRKTDPATGLNQTGSYTRLGSKTVVFDYPSLQNPTVITSTVSHGDTSGYRSMNSYLGDDGNIYQATQRDSDGAHILRINQNNEYDNSYVLSLDTALGITGSTVENWKYAGDGIAYVMYSYANAPVSSLTTQPQSFLARVDLNARTAQRVDLPYEIDMYFFQHQGILVYGDDVIIPVSAVGKNGNIYIINRKTGAVTKGAKLINKEGAQFIGAF